MRILALADAPPPWPVAELVAACRPELAAWTEGLEALDVPKLGVR